MTRLYNAVAIAYVAGMIYVITEPWHEEIGETLSDSIRNVRSVWEKGNFYLQAKVDTLIITKGM